MELHLFAAIVISNDEIYMPATWAVAQVMSMVVCHNSTQILQVQNLLKNLLYLNKLSAQYFEDQSAKDVF